MEAEIIQPQRIRKYRKIWDAILAGAPEKKRITVRVNHPNGLKTIRKAVWKEKGLDLENREKFVVHCEFVVNETEKKYNCIFWVEKIPDEKDI